MVKAVYKITILYAIVVASKTSNTDTTIRITDNANANVGQWSKVVGAI